MMAVTGASRARVLAQARPGRGRTHWLLERLTAVALVPLALWFVVAAVGLSGADYARGRGPGSPRRSTPRPCCS